MGTTTTIEWCHHTFNPWRGCTKILEDPCCEHCYAERNVSVKLHNVGWGPDAERRIAAESTWQKPLVWNRKAERTGERQRVFCGSLMDCFEYRPELLKPRRQVLELVTATPWLNWLFLTKRPHRILQMTTPSFWLEHQNAWAGTTVGTEKWLHRIDTLKSCRASKLFLSLEPLLGPLPTLGEHLDGIDWVIAGGESGPSARPAHPDWFRSVRDQCQAAGVPFFFKGWGKCIPLATYLEEGEIVRLYGRDRRIQAGTFGMKYVRVGKKHAGRLLDDRVWDEVPNASDFQPIAS